MVMLLYIMMPLHLFHIIFFWLPVYGGEAIPLTVEYQWRMGIISNHALMIVFALPSCKSFQEFCSTAVDDHPFTYLH